MAFSASDFAHTHVELLESTLRQMAQRRASMRLALSDAELALERAQREVDALRLEDNTMHASYTAFQADIDARLAALEREKRAVAASRVRRILATFPAELLRAIFLEATNLEDELWPPGSDNRAVCDYEGKAAATPFRIASVDRRWRTLALDTADIWTCVIVSDLGADGSGCLQRVRTMLKRSKNRDICVLISWGSCRWRSSSYCILRTLGEQAHRWRRATITGQDDMPESEWGFLHRPMGRLEDLNLWTRSGNMIDWSVESEFQCLPLHPKLRRLRNNVLFTTARQRLPMLAHLYMISNISAQDKIWASLCMAPSLVELHIELPAKAPRGQWPDEAPPRLVLPHLRVLGLHGDWEPPAAWLSSLELPILESLTVHGYSLDYMPPLFNSVAPTLTSLEITNFDGDCSCHIESDIPHIRKLQQLRHIILSDCTYITPEVTAVFASREASGLPHLKNICFRNPKLRLDQTDDIPVLMHLLCPCPSPAESDALSFSLEAKAGGVPDWLLLQYRFLTGNGTQECDEVTSLDPSTSGAPLQTGDGESIDGSAGGELSSYVSDSVSE